MNYRIAIACAAAMALAGCAVDKPGSTTVGTVPAPVVEAATPTKVQQITAKVCGYIPTVATVAGIVTASPFVPAAGAVAEAICQAISTLPLADGPGDHLPRVNGVVVQGSYVKPPRLK